MRIAPQTLLAPIISNLLYMTVFVLAFAALRDDPDAFIAFLAPGLIMLGVLNNASANSSSSQENSEKSFQTRRFVGTPAREVGMSDARPWGPLNRILREGVSSS